MEKTKKYVRNNRIVMTQPSVWIASLLKAFPIAKVDVTRAVFGNTKEYQAMEKTIRPRLTADQCANTAIKKKKMASLSYT